MIREYAEAREYLDEVTGQVERLVRRYHRMRTGADDPAALRAIAELDLEADRADEMIRARCAASHALGIDLPLDRLRRAFALSPTEARLVEVLVAFELAAQVREAAAPYLDKDGMTTIAVVEALVYRSARTRGASSEELVSDGRLFRFHIAELGGSQMPWLARPIKIAPRVVELALGRLRLDPDVAQVATLVLAPTHGAHLLQDPQARAVVAAAVTAQRERAGAPIPLVVGPEGAGRGSLVHAVARELALPVLEVSGPALPRGAALAPVLAAIVREATLFGALVVVRELDPLVGDAERGVDDRLAIVAATLAHSAGPVAATARANVWPPAVHRPVVVVELGLPSEIECETLWRRGVGDADGVAERAAQRYRVTPGVIERAAAFANVQAAARSGPVLFDDVRVGIRVQLDRELSTLGRRVEWKQTWDDVVLPDDVRDEIDELVARIRHRRHVLHDWGFARKLAKGTGVSALFSGPPGTGKTMVAALVAQELELDLYMIDASRMVSKWIGETEKNLARLFDAAAAGHVALLFDEADSLFAKRTEVKSSTDRYANLEVNYLLQRMEAFEGITILTTNFASSIDDAFKRRLAFRIAFAMPESEEREHLWRAMLPAEAAVAGDIDFAALADKYEMSGGYIRNAVVRAAYLAAADHTPIAMRHLRRGALLEYTAMGKVVHSAGGL
ncbi:MAG TPA: ATP-binding protein [Kofleriaceae bacterium]|nr:ATP-binding protein [Kofleriaceae bacterium]